MEAHRVSDDFIQVGGVKPFWVRMGEMLRIIFPCIFSSFFVMLQELVNLAFVGHLGSADAIAAVGLGNAAQNMIAVSVIVGMNGAINTLVSHAAGAKDIDLCLLYLRRAQIVIVLCFIPISLLILNSDRILVFIGQNEAVSRLAHLYNLAYLPANLLYGLNHAQRRFLTHVKRTYLPLGAPVRGTPPPSG